MAKRGGKYCRLNIDTSQALLSARTERQLTLSWGVIPALVDPFTETDEIFDLAGSWAQEHGFVQPGQRLVVTAGVPVGQPGMTNLLKIIEIENT